MHVGVSYSLKEFIFWTRRNIYKLIIIGLLPVILYQVIGLRWIGLPWTVTALLGTATAFIVGFKNTQTYSRTWEARTIWGGILNSSRSWGITCRDFIDDEICTRKLVYRHFAWLTALRYQLRESRQWETSSKAYNAEYQQYYSIPEKESPLEDELAKYLSQEELSYILSTKNRAAQILSLQSASIKNMESKKQIDTLKFLEFEKLLREFYDHQGKAERIKNFPYPRQFASINSFFITLFCILLPFSMLNEFEKLNDAVSGIMKGYMVWLVVPFSVLVSWVYTSLEQVGESTENPFEGSANDVPISQIARSLEIELRQLLGEQSLPPELLPQHDIIL